MEKLKQEMEKDQEMTNRHKQKMIEEVKSYDKTKMFKAKKRSFFHKLKAVLGYGKER